MKFLILNFTQKDTTRLNKIQQGGQTGFSLGLDDMEGDLSPPYGGTSIGGQSSNRGDGWGGTYTLWGGTHTSNSF